MLDQHAWLSHLRALFSRRTLRLCVSAVNGVLLRHLARQRLGGFTGDVADALVVIAEAVLLLVCAFVV